MCPPLCPVDEGPVFAMCMTSQGDQTVLNQWISGLQQTNPVLGQVPTLFRLDAGPKELQAPPSTESDYQQHHHHHHHPPAEPESQRRESHHEEEGEVVLEEEQRRSQGMKQ